MKATISSNRWQLLLLAAPLVLILAVAIATGGMSGAADAAYGGYGCGAYVPCDQAPPASYGLGNELLYVANGNASDILVIDANTMRQVDTIPVPDADGSGTAWEVHGMVPSKDRSSMYAVGALSGTSADITMYEIDTATKSLKRTIGPLTGSNVGYCGFEYDRNDENSNLVYTTNMATPLMGSTNSVGGWQEVDISTGTVGRFIPTDANGNGESSTCGVSWDASGTHGYAGLMFDAPSSETEMDWPGATTLTYNPSSGTPGISYHQNTVAKSRGLLFQSGGTGNVLDVFDISTGSPILVGTIDLVALTGAPNAEPHGPEISSVDENILYLNARQVPDSSGGSLLVIDVSNVTAPKLLGTIQGTNDASCGVFAMSTASWNPGQPALSLSLGAVYWASMADYTNSILSVDFNIANGGPDAKDVTITGTSNSGGVTSVNTPSLPQDIATAGFGTFTVEYYIPSGVTAFGTTVHASAQSGATIYSY